MNSLEATSVLSERNVLAMRFFGPAVAWLLTVTAVLAQASGRAANRYEAGVYSYYAKCYEQWGALLKRAGEPKDQLVLESRLLPVKAVSGSTIALVLSIRNIGDCPASIPRDFQWPRPIILIQDSAGKHVRLSKAGLHWVHSIAVIHVGPRRDILPGDALGIVVPLKDYFALSEPGVYKVLATKSFREEPMAYIVAKPLVLELAAPPVLGDHAKPPERALGPLLGTTPAGGLRGDKEWLEFVSQAGSPHYGCVLDAMISPIRPEAVNLVISLIRVGAPEGVHASVADYRILLRDPMGRPMRVVPSGLSASPPLGDVTRRPMRVVDSSRNGLAVRFGDINGHIESSSLGDAVGDVIPLAKLYDMSKSGEYSVLVTLPSEGKNEPTWVSKPIKVKVGR